MSWKALLLSLLLLQGRLVYVQKVFTECTVPLLTLQTHMRGYLTVVQTACIAAATGQL